MSAMTKTERNELAQLVRRRERVMKTAAAQRAAELVADVEKKLGSIYCYDQDETWRAAAEMANAAVAEAQAQIERRCEELGIPKNFAPSVGFNWYGRGENAVEKRRTELRKMAVTRIAAMEKAARTEIERHSVQQQTELLAGGLTSDAAKAFIEKMPTVESLMPPLDEGQIKGLIEGQRT